MVTNLAFLALIMTNSVAAEDAKDAYILPEICSRDPKIQLSNG